MARWYKHIESWGSEHVSLPGSSTAGEVFVGGAAAKKAAEDDDDDDVDLFGSDDEEDAEAERIKAERVKAYEAKKAAKPKTVAKVRRNFTVDLYSSYRMSSVAISCIYRMFECHIDSHRIVRRHLRGQALG